MKTLKQTTIDRLKRQDPACKHLHIPYHQMSIKDACNLADALSVNRSLRSLNLEGCFIEYPGILWICEALRDHGSIQTLNCSALQLRDKEVKALHHVMMEARHLRVVKLRGNLMTSRGVAHLAHALEHSHVLALHLDGNHVDAKGAKSLAASLARAPALEQLSLRHNRIGSLGMRALVQALGRNRSLHTLDVYANGIEADGLRGMPEMLARNSSLRTLDLSCNPLEAKGMAYVAEGLVYNHGVEHLLLGHTYDEAMGTYALAHALIDNRTLITLDVTHHDMNDQGALVLAEALTGNHHLQRLMLDGNNIGCRGAKSLVDILCQTPRSGSLSLKHNMIEHAKFNALIKTVQKPKGGHDGVDKAETELASVQDLQVPSHAMLDIPMATAHQTLAFFEETLASVDSEVEETSSLLKYT